MMSFDTELKYFMYMVLIFIISNNMKVQCKKWLKQFNFMGKNIFLYINYANTFYNCKYVVTIKFSECMVLLHYELNLG